MNASTAPATYAELAVMDGQRTITVVAKGDDFVDTLAEIDAPDVDNIDRLTRGDELLLAEAGYAVVAGEFGVQTELGVAFQVEEA